MSDREGQIPLFGGAETSDPPSGPPPGQEAPGPTARADGTAVSPAVEEGTPAADGEPFGRPAGSVADERGTGPAAGAGEEAASVAAPEELPAPGATAETAIPVADLNSAARELLEGHFPPLWVVGEVANWHRANSGHRYFTLRDETAQLSCVMWRSDARRLPTEPEEGMEVVAFGQVSLYEARGDYQLVVRRMEARGEGLWRLAFEKLKRRLAEEGLLDPELRRPLPRVPRRVGVVTSRTGAALRDVASVIRRRAPWTRVLVSHCRVQGDGAAEEIVAALERLARHGSVDVIVATRGGGSVEDLWAFNEEPVARAIAGCPVPVVSAVGHEVDVTIADLVADARAPTPSAAGELVVPDGGELRRRLRGIADRLVEGLRGRTRRGLERAARAGERLVGVVRRRLERTGARLDRVGARLDALSPLGTLRRGYAVPMDGEGRVLRSVTSFTPGEAFDLRVVDGRVSCRAEELEELGTPEGAGEAD